jgi:hypothetical protein
MSVSKAHVSDGKDLNQASFGAILFWKPRAVLVMKYPAFKMSPVEIGT